MSLKMNLLHQDHMDYSQSDIYIYILRKYEQLTVMVLLLHYCIVIRWHSFHRAVSMTIRYGTIPCGTYFILQVVLTVKSQRDTRDCDENDRIHFVC